MTWDVGQEIASGHADSIWHRILALNGAGRYAEALAFLEPMFSRGDPGLMAVKLRGQSLHGLQRWAEAAGMFALVVQRTPGDGAAYEHLATALLPLNRLDQALMTVERGLRWDVDHRGLLRLRLVLLWRLGRRDEAMVLADRHLDRFPDDGAVCLERGIFFLELGNDGAALSDFEAACTWLPNDSRCHNNRAVALWRLGRYPAGLEAVERAVALDPNNARAQHHRALLLLFLGYFTIGFPAYEWRLRDPDHGAALPSLSSSLWTGEDMQESVLLVYPEQGYGDTIHFIRFLPLAARRVGGIVFLCTGPLVPLLRTAPGVGLLWQGEEPRPEFHVHVSLMSLPAVLRLSMDSFSDGRGYLPEFSWIDPGRRRGGRLRVGLVWRGRPTHRNDHNRSLDLAWFEPVLNLEFFDWVSLQEGEGRREIERMGWNMETPELSDFAATARIIQTLDLVVTVDTAVAHLAGAMGCPVWVLLPLVPDWRWGPEGRTTFWYQSMRLFRQTRLGDWGEVRERLVRELRNMIKDGSGKGSPLPGEVWGRAPRF
ncbi:MAG: glycosyltransferase family protein [Magnetococcales bacterium]|nr:glycosyltransferase family protein [Magnetococcales bacterium]